MLRLDTLLQQRLVPLDQGERPDLHGSGSVHERPVRRRLLLQLFMRRRMPSLRYHREPRSLHAGRIGAASRESVTMRWGGRGALWRCLHHRDRNRLYLSDGFMPIAIVQRKH